MLWRWGEEGPMPPRRPRPGAPDITDDHPSLKDVYFGLSNVTVFFHAMYRCNR